MDMSHLVPVEVIGILPIASVIDYREEDEWQWGKDNKPLYNPDGSPLTKKVIVPVTQDVSKGGIAYLDPAVTNIPALTQGGLVRFMPKKDTAPKAGKGA